MKEISLESLPPCFEKWCLKFDDLWENKGKKTGFRCYLAEETRFSTEINQKNYQEKILPRHCFNGGRLWE